MNGSAPLRPARRRARAVLIALFGLMVFVTPASAAPPHLETWHRLNPATEDVAPEHEQLHCLPGVQWVCRYDKAPEPNLGYHWDRTIGMFHGRDYAFTPDECPDWFDPDVCEGVERVIAGWITYATAGGGAFRTGHALIFTDGDGIAPLYVYWFNAGFACPWFGSFDDALAENPTGEAFDCFVAP